MHMICGVGKPSIIFSCLFLFLILPVVRDTDQSFIWLCCNELKVVCDDACSVGVYSCSSAFFITNPIPSQFKNSCLHEYSLQQFLYHQTIVHKNNSILNQKYGLFANACGDWRLNMAPWYILNQ